MPGFIILGGYLINVIIIFIIALAIYFILRKKISFARTFLIIVCVFIIMGFISEKISNKIIKNENEFVVKKYIENNFIVISEENLLTYFENNYIEADLKYFNQVLLLTGRITNIGAPDKNEWYIVFNPLGNNSLNEIKCCFANIEIGDIKNGDIITVIGKYNLYNNKNTYKNEIILKNCKIMEIQEK